MPAIAMPAARKRSNIQRSSAAGYFSSVGAYQTHGFGVDARSDAAGIRNAVCPATVNTSPGSGRTFTG